VTGDLVIWAAVRVQPVVGGISLPGQQGGQQVQIVPVLFPVAEGITPEQAAMDAGIFPLTYAYLRPAVGFEVEQYFTAFPDRRPAVLPEVFVTGAAS